jgi:uncharacterized protein YecT (DUF1311 family)
MPFSHIEARMKKYVGSVAALAASVVMAAPPAPLANAAQERVASGYAGVWKVVGDNSLVVLAFNKPAPGQYILTIGEEDVIRLSVVGVEPADRSVNATPHGWSDGTIWTINQLADQHGIRSIRLTLHNGNSLDLVGVRRLTASDTNAAEYMLAPCAKAEKQSPAALSACRQDLFASAKARIADEFKRVMEGAQFSQRDTVRIGMAQFKWRNDLDKKCGIPVESVDAGGTDDQVYCHVRGINARVRALQQGRI